MTTVDDTRVHAEPVPDPRAPYRAAAVERLSLLALLVGTALLYIVNLGASGNANDFYAAAVQAGTKSWKAFFFGSFDSSNFITVDKPPASLWPMEIAGRLFGFNSWSMLVPQAIEGVLAVWLLHATVKRWYGHWAGLLAGGLLAITPVAALMFRFNNPDAMMTLLIVVAAYCVVRALEDASTRWLLVAGLVMGFSFLAKGLQPFTVLPGLGLAYLICAPTPFLRRLWQALAAGVAVVVGAGWWVLIVQLTPASDRPYIGGSGNNSALGLAFGYNGVSRLTGSTGGPGGGGGFDGSTGIGRLFNALNGGQIAWLLPTALVLAVGAGVVAGRRGRTDRLLASGIIWLGWLLVTGGVLSFAGGIIHTYYTIELAPAIAALVAIGAVTLWRARDRQAARVALAAAALVTGSWGWTLLDRSSSWHPWVRYVVVIAAIVSAALLIVPPDRGRRGLVACAAVAGLLALTSGSAAYAVDAAATAQTGSTPTAGPASSTGGFGGPGRLGARIGGARIGGARIGGRPGGAGDGGFPGGFPGSAGGGQQPPAGAPGGGATPTARGAGGAGNAQANAALVSLLKKTSTTWAAAAIGSQSAAPLELSSGKAVMAIGGFSGSDAAPTLAQFEKLVAEGKVGYFVGSGGGGFGGRGVGTGSQISSWVAAHFTATTVGGSTVYDLSKKAS